ncbi:calcium-activated chloride channel regulator 4-like [Lepisosteus oculatus]|uniref:calcium-activated chloride channel regulator 4-like n=1 Tax=Lepisosteus oculatus TaxID=7918 RepID=UPI00371ECF32
MNPPKPAVRPDIMVTVEAFSRTKPGQTFSITKQPPENSDVLPPCRINDLMAVFENQKVRLSWTAPGDDLDKGTAAEYKIKMGENVFDLRDRFESAFQVNPTHVTPSPAGTREELEQPIEGMDQMNGTIVYFAICAVDENGLMSEMSNIAQVAIIEPLVPAGPELKVLLSQDNGEDSDSDSDSNEGGLGSVSVVGIAVTTTILSVCLVLGLIRLFMHKREQGDYTLRDGPEVERVPMASNV